MAIEPPTHIEQQDPDFPVFKPVTGPQKSLFLLPYADEEPESDRAFSNEERDCVEAIARYMGEADYAPAIVLASRTERAREAVDILTGSLGRKPAVFLERALHYCTVHDMIQRLRCVSNLIPSVLLVSGQRMLEDLALQLAQGYGPYAARAARHKMMRNFPGGAFAALSLAVESWGAIAPKSGLLQAFIRPQDLQPQDH